MFSCFFILVRRTRTLFSGIFNFEPFGVNIIIYTILTSRTWCCHHPTTPDFGSRQKCMANQTKPHTHTLPSAGERAKNARNDSYKSSKLFARNSWCCRVLFNLHSPTYSYCECMHGISPEYVWRVRKRLTPGFKDKLLMYEISQICCVYSVMVL